MLLKQTDYNEKVKMLLKQDEIMSLNIVGVLSYPVEAQIYVDNEEEPTGVYIEVDGVTYLYTKELTFVDKMFKTFKKKESYIFSGIERGLAEYIKERYTPIWENPCDIYYYPHNKIESEKIQSDVVSISVDEAEWIDYYYTFKSEWSLGEIQANLRLRPSAGIYEDGQLVCWVLAHEDDSLGIMYTLEDYRRKGYAIDVTLAIVDKMLKLNKVPYLQIIESNGMSPGLAAKCGFVKAGKCTWMEVQM